MQSCKAESGSFKTLSFPPFNTDLSLIKDKSVFVIEDYCSYDLISIIVKYLDKQDPGFIIKLLNKQGEHQEPNELYEKVLGFAIQPCLNMMKILRLNDAQLFFAVKEDNIMLVDVFSNNYISPGMLQDTFGKVISTQKVINKVKIDDSFNKKDHKNHILKPVIPIYHNETPIYIKL